MGRHEAPPLGSAARDATAPPYHGRHRAPEHMYYPDLPCWCGGMPAFGEPHRDHDERAERVADERWTDPEDTHQGGPDDV